MEYGKINDIIKSKDFEVQLQKRFNELEEDDKNFLVGCLSLNEDMSIDALELHAEFLRFQIFSIKYEKDNK